MDKIKKDKASASSDSSVTLLLPAVYDVPGYFENIVRFCGRHTAIGTEYGKIFRHREGTVTGGKCKVVYYGDFLQVQRRLLYNLRIY